MRKLKTTEINRITTETFKESTKIPLIVVLDNVRSMYNVGSIFRTSDAFRVQQVILCGITATPPDQEIHKTALGAENSVNWTYSPFAAPIIKNLKKQGFEILVVEQTNNSIMIQNFVPSIEKKYVIIFGNEVKGVSDDLISIADAALEIPQSGTKHSLNVSVSAAITIWKFYESLYKLL